jgi:hypothetical protein
MGIQRFDLPLDLPEPSIHDTTVEPRRIEAFAMSAHYVRGLFVLEIRHSFDEINVAWRTTHVLRRAGVGTIVVSVDVESSTVIRCCQSSSKS